MTAETNKQSLPVTSVFKLGKNELFCNGSLILSKYYKWMLLTASIILFAMALLAYMIAVTITEHSAMVILYIFQGLFVLATLSFLIKTGCMDPGIIERNYKLKLSDVKKKSFLVIKNGFLIKLNLCLTCNIVRPPRTSHCQLCDNCVARFDHHCKWLGNCIGRRNYKFFLYFLFNINFLSLYGLALGIYLLFTNARVINTLDEGGLMKSSNNYTNVSSRNNTEINSTQLYVNHSVSASLGALFLIIILGFSIFLFGKLLIDHIWLSSNMLTFYEFYKKKWEKFPIKGKNPYSVDKRQLTNFMGILFEKPIGPYLSLFSETYPDLSSKVDNIFKIEEKNIQKNPKCGAENDLLLTNDILLKTPD